MYLRFDKPEKKTQERARNEMALSIADISQVATPQVSTSNCSANTYPKKVQLQVKKPWKALHLR